MLLAQESSEPLSWKTAAKFTSCELALAPISSRGLFGQWHRRRSLTASESETPSRQLVRISI